MSLKVKEVDKYIVIYLGGKMDVYLASEVEGELKEIIQQNKKDVILNLSEVDSFSSSGLRVMVSIQRLLKESNRNLKLCNLPLGVRKVFEVIDLVSMFQIYDSEEHAITSL